MKEGEILRPDWKWLLLYMGVEIVPEDPGDIETSNDRVESRVGDTPATDR